MWCEYMLINQNYRKMVAARRPVLQTVQQLGAGNMEIKGSFSWCKTGRLTRLAVPSWTEKISPPSVYHLSTLHPSPNHHHHLTWRGCLFRMFDISLCSVCSKGWMHQRNMLLSSIHHSHTHAMEITLSPQTQIRTQSCVSIEKSRNHFFILFNYFHRNAGLPHHVSKFRRILSSFLSPPSGLLRCMQQGGLWTKLQMFLLVPRWRSTDPSWTHCAPEHG